MLDLIFIAYLILCGFLLGIRHRRDRREWLLRFILATALPVIGFLLPLFWRKRWHEQNASHASERIAELDVAVTIGDLSGHTGVYLDVRQAAFATFSATANPPAIRSLRQHVPVRQFQSPRVA